MATSIVQEQKLNLPIRNTVFFLQYGFLDIGL